MTPMDSFIARTNIVRMRLQLATSVDAETQATLQQLLKEQFETLRAGEAEEDTKPICAVDGQTLGQYRAWIREARARHPYADSEERMYAVMLCESRGQAAIVNPAGPYSGLFQYSGATWSGDWNTYRDQDILDPRAQIFATALAWSNGMQRQWGCYSRPH